jgi:hypothetical protein
VTEDDIKVGQALVERMVVLMQKQDTIAKQMQEVIVEMQDYITRATTQ